MNGALGAQLIIGYQRYRRSHDAFAAAVVTEGGKSEQRQRQQTNVQQQRQ